MLQRSLGFSLHMSRPSYSLSDNLDDTEEDGENVMSSDENKMELSRINTVVCIPKAP